ncbi:MAG: beta-aspartyl-peptidase [Firmicutes bacterium]|nr:beta-aspartyl-peptidase [Bacillota bacterium]
MIKIIKNANVYSPEPIGKRDILILDERIAHIAEKIDPPTGLGEVEVVDVKGATVVPGFIDQHVHIIGGGGEGGPATRTPEIQLSQITTNGVTTVVGCLGTDGTTRHMYSLLAKARALEIEGITTFIYTGAYEVPTPTILDNVRDDVALIDKVIGVGEIAISDHRSAQPSVEDLKKLAAEARVGGLLGGKPGLVHFHVGGGPRGIQPIFDILESTELPITIFTPTHMNRNPQLLEQGARFAKQGGKVDITAGRNAYKGIMRLLNEFNVPIENITISSDGNGSMPRFDQDGNLVGLGVGSVRTNLETWRDVMIKGHVPMEEALKILTTNVAENLKLTGKKGCIAVGADADIVELTDELEINRVWTRGRLMVENGEAIVKGTFEQ